ncbi:MAG: Rne/Rng family ribonuclease [Acidobacteria bacterium]|nr:Rne/Rng family ribonuclease [Acidobacteriota bacterium]MCB9396436.1 Rne/Rng family ribonuclease [Acidobacteriota bacterium]
MNKYKLLINAKDFDEIRVAMVNEDGVLEQVDFETIGKQHNALGNIYKASITAIEPSLQATFVDYGGSRHGFLPFNEIHPRYFLNNDRRLPVEKRVQLGQELLVQVAREEIGQKGAYMTTFLSLAGRYLVMMPFSKRIGISRKIEDNEERASLRKVVDKVTVPHGMGYIIRTAGLGKSEDQIQRDINVLVSTWREMEARSKEVPSGSLLYREDNVVNRTIRDYFTEEVTEILIDEQSAYEEIRAYFMRLMPKYAHIVKLYRGKAPIFSKYQIEDQVEKIFSRKIKLPSGGSIVIEQTEALVVIDVNSGKTAEGNLELTALKTNMEAAEELARQLRLRDLGGLIVIDFIDMRERRNSQDVENRLRDCLKEDKARITMTSVSRFGLLEMSRQRIKTSKEIKHYEDCPVCRGLGRVKTLETQGLDLLRRMKQLVSGSYVRGLNVSLSEDLGLYLLNHRRKEVLELEQKFSCDIQLQLKVGQHVTPRFEVIKGSSEDKEAMPKPAPLSLASMAASMSEKDLNEKRDYREEKIEAVRAMTFDELRAAEIPVPSALSPFDQFNFTMRVLMMKRFGLYEGMTEVFKDAICEKVMGSGPFGKGEEEEEDPSSLAVTEENVDDGPMDDADYADEDEDETESSIEVVETILEEDESSLSDFRDEIEESEAFEPDMEV